MTERTARVLILCFFIFCSVCFAAVEEQPAPPFSGVVTTDNVNIRAGSDRNFEILAKANKGDPVFVTDQVQGWYKIELPKNAYCYVSKDFIEKYGTMDVAKVSDLNLRARPNANSSIIGQIQKADAVEILNENGEGWYQIRPPKTSYGWIFAKFVEKANAPAKEIKAEDTKPTKPKRRFLWW